jgi:hypothetical protein
MNDLFFLLFLLWHRNRINSDYITHSEQSSKFPFTFEELNRALLSYDTSDVFQQEQPQGQPQTYPSILPPLSNTFTCRTVSLSSSSTNSSLTPQYI